MQKIRLFFLGIIFIIILIFYGFSIGFYKIFPFEELNSIKNIIIQDDKKIYKKRLDLDTQNEVIGNFDNIMLGDSIFYHGLWSEYFPNISIANRGIGGATSQGTLGRIPGILAHNPKTVFIHVGINDLSSGMSPSQTLKNLESMVDVFSISVDVAVLSVLECSKKVCGKRLEAIKKLNLEISEMVLRKGVIFINLNQVMSDENGLKDSFSFDGVHPNGAGYIKISEIIKPYMTES